MRRRLIWSYNLIPVVCYLKSTLKVLCAIQSELIQIGRPWQFTEMVLFSISTLFQWILNQLFIKLHPQQSKGMFTLSRCVIYVTRNKWLAKYPRFIYLWILFTARQQLHICSLSSYCHGIKLYDWKKPLLPEGK